MIVSLGHCPSFRRIVTELNEQLWVPFLLGCCKSGVQFRPDAFVLLPKDKG